MSYPDPPELGISPEPNLPYPIELPCDEPTRSLDEWISTRADEHNALTPGAEFDNIGEMYVPVNMN